MSCGPEAGFGVSSSEHLEPRFMKNPFTLRSSVPKSGRGLPRRARAYGPIRPAFSSLAQLLGIGMPSYSPAMEEDRQVLECASPLAPWPTLRETLPASINSLRAIVGLQFFLCAILGILLLYPSTSRAQESVLIRELASREFSIHVENGSSHLVGEIVSREFSFLVVSTAPPPPITSLGHRGHQSLRHLLFRHGSRLRPSNLERCSWIGLLTTSGRSAMWFGIGFM